MVGVLSLALAAPVLAASEPMEMDTCQHVATIASLRQCVSHAEMMGHITNPVIAARLQSFLNQADLALAHGHAGVVASWLDGFSRLVQNSVARGLIDPLAAQHLVEHAHLVQHALLNPAR